MQRLLTLLIIISFISCKETKTESPQKEELTTVQKIANAHGYEHWDNVTSIQFRFGGKADNPNSGRLWQWNPNTNDITLKRDTIVFNYNRNNMDSIAIKSDRAFINDKFWALIPFQLLWDEGTTISEVEKATSPVKQVELNKLTITYSNEGGYTPGDAYDIYFDDNHIIQEWSFRKGNAPEPSLSNTFEDYGEFGGIKIAQSHKKAEGDWNLLLRDIKVALKD